MVARKKNPVTKNCITVFFCCFLWGSDVHAGIGRDMSNFFSKFGANINHTKGSAYHDQSGGYYSGGSFFMRAPSRNLKPLNMTTPGFRMGCGGIDIWTGGMSYINAQQLKDTLNSIIAAAPSYAFMLAVETYAPQVHNIMQQLNKLASDFNRMNINSCETAAGLVGGMWPKSDLGSQATCRMLSSHNGSTSDWAKARHDCSGNPEHAHHKAPTDTFVGPFNLAWKALDKMNFDLQEGETKLNPFGDDGKEGVDQHTLKELFMTFSGTVIKKEDGKKRILPALGDRESFLKAFMSGGKVKVYKCDESSRCLNPKVVDVSLDKDQALHAKIVTILDGIALKIQSDEGDLEPTPAEQAIINATSLPLYKFINVTTAYQKGHAPITLAEYGEIIALDIVVTYIQDVLMLFKEAIANLRDVQFSDDDFDIFLRGIRETQQSLVGVKANAFQKMDQMMGFVQKTQMIETQLHQMMGTMPSV